MIALIELLFRIVKGLCVLVAAIIFFWIFIWDVALWNKSFETAFMANGNGVLLILTIMSAAISEMLANRVEEIFEKYLEY